MRTSRGGRRAGFSLLEILAAMGLLALILTLLVQVRFQAIGKAGTARAYSIATRLGVQLLHRIEAGLVADLDDGYRGDFSDAGFGDYRYTVGVGDGSNWADVGGDVDPAEEVLRRFRETQEQEADESVKPEYTRIFLTVEFPSYREEGTEQIQLETLIPTWAVEQDFPLYRTLWPDLQPAAID